MVVVEDWEDDLLVNLPTSPLSHVLFLSFPSISLHSLHSLLLASVQKEEDRDTHVDNPQFVEKNTVK